MTSDSLMNGERQVAPAIDKIRRDHVARYEFAARMVPQRSSIVDVACGIGYGSFVLAQAGHAVYAVDRSAAAASYGAEHYPHRNIFRRIADVMDVEGLPADSHAAAVCFETIEHLADPRPMLRALARVAPMLIASVPNETVFPHGGSILHHYRHYTRDEFARLLAETGWVVEAWYGQEDRESEVEPGIEGRTIVAVARRAEVAQSARAEPSVPEHVLILGLGPSLETYVDIAKRLGGRHAFADEVWGINAVAGILQCDRVFHMDDVRVQEVRAAARPESNIAKMLEWLRVHPGPIYTSRAHPAYPGLVEFPLQDVINSCGWAYMNSTAAYAVAYAVHIGVKQISLFGVDFTYQDSHKAEKGRGCVEFHLGIAAARGIKIGFPDTTSLMDACAPIEERLYGYDTVHLSIDGEDDGPVTVTMTPREQIATADEIEARYDHAKHPNPLMKSAS